MSSNGSPGWHIEGHSDHKEQRHHRGNENQRPFAKTFAIATWKAVATALGLLLGNYFAIDGAVRSPDRLRGLWCCSSCPMDRLPSRHFVSFSEIVIYRSGGLAAVWCNFAMVAVTGPALFTFRIAFFRKSIAATK